MSNMDDLSMLQKQVLMFVKAHMNNYAYPPTIREIARGTGIKSTSTVHNILNVLEQKGYINRDSGQSRSTVLSGVAIESGVYSIPLLSQSGQGVNFGFIDIPKSLVSDRAGVFAVKSEVDIVEKFVMKDDILILVSCSAANEGEFVLCRNNALCLYEDGMEITGKVLASIRHY